LINNPFFYLVFGGGCLRKVIISLAVPVTIIILWSFLTFLNFVPSYILPTPYDVLTSFFELLVSGELFIDMVSTIIRITVGFLIAAAVAIPIGIGIGWSKEIETLLNSVIQILRPIPPLAWIPFALLWFGLGLQSEVFIIFIGAFFPILLNTIDGVKGVEKVFIEAAYTLGASERQLLSNVVLPASLPGIFTGLRIGIGIGFMSSIAAEMIAAKSGLGYLIMKAMRLIDTGDVIVGMLTIGVIGFVINLLFKKAEDRYILWRGKYV
jgi:NitT/TauT family transport system permease protein